MFPTKDHLEQSHALHAFASEIRGKFLNIGSWIETLLADIIAEYFCRDAKRRRLFFSEVATEMRLSAKAALLDKILEHHFHEIHSGHPGLKKRLDAFRQFRNRLAHSHIDTSEAVLAAKKSDEVMFIFYDQGQTKRQNVTRAEAQRRAQDANKLHDDLLKIQRAITASA
jgi:hypothetical protein